MCLSNLILTPIDKYSKHRECKVGGAIDNKNVKNIKRVTHSEWRETLGEGDCTAKEQ